ncbi:hypothetical protein HZI73_11265 [Vallitalea pronyensis]|uniref:Uncharacterized protein n=1 Tax=Vallitalea pronyensis TaxID=1348613 RepID=A0A8J8MJ82_9FIRM|nr:hypothetical protein [Vallitalea pronyensis]QUI22832.1 hypothetical protein HZI73_11265 [Vallitalea pronyensis]
MEEVIGYLKKRNQLVYDINCIKKYIEGGDYDKSLKRAWERYKQELIHINNQIDQIREPQLKAFEEEKDKIVSAIQEHEREIKLLKKQLKELDRLIVKLQTTECLPLA